VPLSECVFLICILASSAAERSNVAPDEHSRVPRPVLPGRVSPSPSQGEGWGEGEIVRLYVRPRPSLCSLPEGERDWRRTAGQDRPWHGRQANVGPRGPAEEQPGSASATSRAEAPSDVILSERSYWRAYYRWSPARVSRSGLAARGVDVSRPRPDRPFHYLYPYSHQGHGSAVTGFITSAVPPADWREPDFDDRAWPRYRLPLGTWNAGSWAQRPHGLGLACFRGRFHVADPEQVEALTLAITYRGGVVVYVNGREVARGHLPAADNDEPPKAGAVTPDTPGADYPAEAYVADVPDARGRVRRRVIPALPGAYRDRVTAGGRTVHLPRDVWQRVRRLRNRELGPVALPKGLLRRGTNVLAVEIHRSDYHPGVVGVRGDGRAWRWRLGSDWLHGYLRRLRLTATPPGAVRPPRRTPGVELWVSDVHRRWLAPEFGEARPDPGVVRLVGARNGSYSAQVVLGTDREVRGLIAAMSDLVATAGGGRIPASAALVRFGVAHPIGDLAALGTHRGSARWRQPQRCREVAIALARCAPPRVNTATGPAESRPNRVAFFDHLSPAPPAVVPANSCQPIWLTVRIPRDAPAGAYRGNLTVRPADTGPIAVPVRLEVVNWTLPDARCFRTVAAIEPSPYGVAAAYGVPLWSDRHLALVRTSLGLLGELGGDIVIVPVLTRTEFGNQADSMVRFRRGAGGAWTCDLSILEAYLDTAVAALGKPRMVCFVVYHAVANNRTPEPRVLVTAAGGGLDEFPVPAPGTPEAARLWSAFTTALQPVMQRRGLLDAVCWGFPWDALDGRFRALRDLLAARLPRAGWVRGCHQNQPDATFRCTMSIYGLPPPLETRPDGTPALVSRRGWREPALLLVLPRIVNAVITVDGSSPPLAYRLLPERALVAGARGFGRIGADYWADTYQRGWTGGARVGMPVMSILWPGKNGPEGGARFEALREGLQEAEARIALEEALERGLIRSEERAARVRRLLEHRVRATLVVPAGSDAPRISEANSGWQRRSRDLYRAVAEVAAGTR